jgi:hypothetical protein
MRQKSGPAREPAEKIVKDIRRMTRRKFSAEDKDPYRAGGPARRGEHRRALPPCAQPFRQRAQSFPIRR